MIQILIKPYIKLYLSCKMCQTVHLFNANLLIFRIMWDTMFCKIISITCMGRHIRYNEFENWDTWG